MKSDPLTLESITDRLLPIATDLRAVADDLLFQVCNNRVECVGDLVAAESLLGAILHAYDYVSDE